MPLFCSHFDSYVSNWTIELESTAPRIASDFKPPHDDLIRNQKRKRDRKERRVKRAVAVVVGWAIMAWMVYLIIVTARTAPKIWDPYEILGVSRVSLLQAAIAVWSERADLVCLV